MTHMTHIERIYYEVDNNYNSSLIYGECDYDNIHAIIYDLACKYNIENILDIVKYENADSKLDITIKSISAKPHIFTTIIYYITSRCKNI